MLLHSKIKIDTGKFHLFTWFLGRTGAERVEIVHEAGQRPQFTLKNIIKIPVDELKVSKLFTSILFY